MLGLRPIAGTGSAIVFLLLALIGPGCRDQKTYETEKTYRQPLDAVQDPGGHVQATSERSVELLSLGPADRRASFQYLLRSQGKGCSVVLSTVLKAGDNGTDLWRVGCADGTWLVTISTETISVEDCANARTSFCADLLKNILWN